MERETTRRPEAIVNFAKRLQRYLSLEKAGAWGANLGLMGLTMGGLFGKETDFWTNFISRPAGWEEQLLEAMEEGFEIPGNAKVNHPAVKAWMERMEGMSLPEKETRILGALWDCAGRGKTHAAASLLPFSLYYYPELITSCRGLDGFFFEVIGWGWLGKVYSLAPSSCGLALLAEEIEFRLIQDCGVEIRIFGFGGLDRALWRVDNLNIGKPLIALTERTQSKMVAQLLWVAECFLPNPIDLKHKAVWIEGGTKEENLRYWFAARVELAKTIGKAIAGQATEKDRGVLFPDLGFAPTEDKILSKEAAVALGAVFRYLITGREDQRFKIEENLLKKVSQALRSPT